MTNKFVNIFTIMLIVLIYTIYNENKNNDLIYVESEKDGRKYLVRNLPDKNDAANLMSNLRENLVTIRDYLESNNSKESRVKRLLQKFNPNNIMENKKGSKYTSYSINKGEKVVFCMRSKDNRQELIDINTMMFVALHELSHIMTASIGHTEEFWKNFKYLLQLAVSLGIYKKVDYSVNPQQYCGMKVTDSPLINK